jgi:hypothetical protein
MILRGEFIEDISENYSCQFALTKLVYHSIQIPFKLNSPSWPIQRGSFTFEFEVHIHSMLNDRSPTKSVPE